MPNETDDSPSTRRAWLQAGISLSAASVVKGCAARVAAAAGHDHSMHGNHIHPSDAEQGHGAFSDADAWTNVFDDPERDAWQLPADVVQALGLAPSMTVADVGAGTGYFAVRLARAVPSGEVIATDLEPDMVRHLNERARNERLPNLRAVRATPGASGLAAGSVDRILVVHVWHHVSERVAYARDLAAALRPGGKLVIVEFSRDARRGPPMDHRLSEEVVISELATAGLRAKVSPLALPDQYMIEAER
jgi:arsenite methyltransferase